MWWYLQRPTSNSGAGTPPHALLHQWLQFDAIKLKLHQFLSIAFYCWYLKETNTTMKLVIKPSKSYMVISWNHVWALDIHLKLIVGICHHPFFQQRNKSYSRSVWLLFASCATRAVYTCRSSDFHAHCKCGWQIHTGLWLADFLFRSAGASDGTQWLWPMETTQLSGLNGMNIHLSHEIKYFHLSFGTIFGLYIYQENTRNHWPFQDCHTSIIAEDVDQSHLGGSPGSLPAAIRFHAAVMSFCKSCSHIESSRVPQLLIS